MAVVQVLIEKRQVDMVNVREHPVARDEEMLHAVQRKDIHRPLVPPRVVEIQQIVQRPVVVLGNLRHHPVDRLADQIILGVAGQKVILDFLRRILCGFHFDLQAVLLLNQVVPLGDGVVDDVAGQLLIGDKLLLAVQVALGGDGKDPNGLPAEIALIRERVGHSIARDGRRAGSGAGLLPAVAAGSQRRAAHR